MSTGDSDRSAAPVLRIELHRISKRYDGAQALDNVSIGFAAGEIHALVGENGAGKSTFGKIVAGAVIPDAGQIILDGRPANFRSPRDAVRAGVALIHQELQLVPAMSILDNVFLGVEPGRAGVVDKTQERRRFEESAARIDFRQPASARVENLRLAERQKVEILRALMRDARVIVMDEPTATLSGSEADRLLQIARDLRDSGVTIIYISHVLTNVLAISDKISVLKDGRLVKTVPAHTETIDSLVTAMLGRSMDHVFPPRVRPRQGTPVLLSVRGLSRPPAFQDVSFDIHQGEIVGLAGLVGSGRSEIARAIFGGDASSGTVEVDGRPPRRQTPRAGIRSGLAFLPESRRDQGLVMVRPVRENVSLVHLGDVSRHGIVRRAIEEGRVGQVLDYVEAQVPNLAMPVSSLSGGNQQKAAMAKWLFKTPKVLLADEPTRGVDVGAKRAIYELLNRLAAQGLGVLLISAELEEILGIAHRILVVRNGRIVRELAASEADERTVMHAVFGNTTALKSELG